MSSLQITLQKDELDDSWVDLYYSNSGQCSPKKDANRSLECSGIYTPLNIEQLLTDAQRESEHNSREASARGSPKGLHSPTNEFATCQQEEQVVNEVGTDWIWDWSSGPEKNPSPDMFQKFRHPANRRKQNEQNSPTKKNFSIFSKKNLQNLLFSHLVAYILGASMIYIFFKKQWLKCGSCSSV